MSAGSGRLRARIEAEARGARLPMSALTVLEDDPYRFDTPAGHRDGEWFAEQVAARGRDEETIHIRGVHYSTAIRGNVALPRPVLKKHPKTGEEIYRATIYQNDDPCWEWMANAASAARWLGHVPFDAITDQRNDKPVIRIGGHASPEAKIALDLEMYLPDFEDLQPRASMSGFKGRQPYRLVIFGEKSSLKPITAPLAESYDSDMFLATGEISSTLVYEMCKAAAADGRRMIVLTLSDFDPAGWQMPISIARKIQAYKDLFFPDLEYAVHPVSLLLEQVIELDLPSTPLKETEKRAAKWKEAWGREQTEIDAVIELRPEALHGQLQAALDRFYDHTLDRRVHAARREWEDRAQEILDAKLDAERVAHIRANAEARLAELEAEVEALNESMRAEVPEDIVAEFPAIEIPEAEVEGGGHAPLISTDMSWVDQTKALIARKRYLNGEDVP